MFAEAVMCLALNMYWEAKNQSMIGQVAVGQVVMNRVEDSRFPNTVCEVVYQGEHRPSWKDPTKDHPVRHRCQFSWYCDGRSDEPNKNSKQWFNAMEYARIVYSGRLVFDLTEGSTHYHATYVRPSWAKTKTRTTRIESHIFYRWEK